MSIIIVINGKRKMTNNTQIRREKVTTITNTVNANPNSTKSFTNTNFEVTFIISNTMDYNLRQKNKHQ